jgi:hypothetical protein
LGTDWLLFGPPDLRVFIRVAWADESPAANLSAFSTVAAAVLVVRAANVMPFRFFIAQHPSALPAQSAVAVEYLCASCDFIGTE